MEIQACNAKDTIVDIIEWPTERDWSMCYWLAVSTTKKDYPIDTIYKKTPLPEWKHKILRARHSPIRRLNYAIHLTNVPYFLQTHLVRHKIGWECFVATQRNDRQTNYDRNTAPQAAPVNMTILCNAESIQTVLAKRLCKKADAQMVVLMNEVHRKILEKTPEFDGLMARPCELFGKCFEMRSCKER
ncbi:MAG: hypothetical protein LBB23_03595 [Rickettsiales bacterium]|jgi:hypothetical protein|nr:hypothetical protein [Rickettsiales bacterium]